MMPPELKQLKNIRRKSGGGWTARCPLHDDKRNSLAIDIGRDGFLLIHCFSGCDGFEIKKRLGLVKYKAQIAKPKKEAETKQQIFSASYYAPLSLRDFKLTHGWGYCDAAGNSLFCVYRLEGPNGKEIRPVKKIEGGYTWGLPPAPRPLYRLPEILETSGLLIVCEGEKACDALIDAGWVATTSAGGSSAADKTDWTPIQNRNVLIWPDNDEPGLKYADSVRVKLESQYCHVEILEPRGGKGDDAADIPTKQIDAFLMGRYDIANNHTRDINGIL